MKEIYVSLSAAMAQEKHLAMLANNLANVNTVGFKKETAVFEVQPPQPRFDLMEESYDPDLKIPPARQRMDGSWNYMRLAKTSIDFSEGDLRATNNPLDVALQEQSPEKGVGFFQVQTPAGTRLSRMGNLRLNDQQELITGEGFRVLGKEGNPIKVTNSQVQISESGEIASGGQGAGALKVVVVERPGDLEKIGNGLFGDRNGTVKSQDMAAGDGISIRQGYLEMSNVNAVMELTRMIETQRAFSSYEKSIQSIDEMSSRAINQAMNA